MSNGTILQPLACEQQTGAGGTSAPLELATDDIIASSFRMSCEMLITSRHSSGFSSTSARPSPAATGCSSGWTILYGRPAGSNWSPKRRREGGVRCGEGRARNPAE